MTYNEYTKIAAAGFARLDNKGKLFWNLWCLQYAFEKIDPSNQFFDNIRNAYTALWAYNDADAPHLDTLLNNDAAIAILDVDDEDYDDLDDLEVGERAVKEMIVALESMIMNLQSDGVVTYNAGEVPINVIDAEIDGISITTENTNNIFLHEAGSHIQLLNALFANGPAYTFKDRNIYRKMQAKA
jgi:hypothetical protein